jgi:hypothetical protein
VSHTRSHEDKEEKEETGGRFTKPLPVSDPVLARYSQAYIVTRVVVIDTGVPLLSTGTSDIGVQSCPTRMREMYLCSEPDCHGMALHL